MKKIQKWLPSFLIVLGSAVFLSLTLRGLGPSGTGVPAMLAYQSAWMSAPAIHANGTIQQTHNGHTSTSSFEVWETLGVDRRAAISSPGGEIVTVVTGKQAWKRTGTDPVQNLDPARAELFPIPDPYASDATFYRTARRWTLAGDITVNGVTCQRIVGMAKGAHFEFDLDPTSHLPQRVRIDELPAAGSPVSSVWVIDFDRIETPRSLPNSLFLKP